MEDFTRDVLEATLDILVTEGLVAAEDAPLFAEDLENDADATNLFNVFAEQARLMGYEQGREHGYDEGYEDGRETFGDSWAEDTEE